MLNSSLEAITHVAWYLGPLRGRVAFLGGAVTGLLLTDPAAPEVRATDDVDVILETVTRSAYYRLEEELRGLGFVQRHADGDPLCRWTVEGVVVDVMPTDEAILGFGNRWYIPAIAHAQTVTLSDGLDIRVISAPYFLATKLEAFRGRGKGDFLGSADMADIVSVVDGRAELVAEVLAADASVREYMAQTIGAYRELEAFKEAVAGHMLPDAASQERVSMVLSRIDQIVGSLNVEPSP